ncbi:hypothetical protein [Neptuniibacter caesariensis]|nr:hypothetical protein [Neptuniibacter caesariensis]
MIKEGSALTYQCLVLFEEFVELAGLNIFPKRETENNKSTQKYH